MRNGFMRAPRGLAVFVAAAALAGPIRTSAGDLEDGLRLAGEGRCSEALPLLARATGAVAERAAALCQLSRGDYVAAAEALARLEAQDPSLTVDLAIARFHAGEHALAQADLERAQARGETRAEIPLYLGLLALEREQAARAAAEFERARALDPLASEPVASYYGGLALLRTGQLAEARASLARVIAEHPGTPWASQAERALATLAAERPPGFASLRIGFEHDTNAVLRGDGVDLGDEIPSERDQRLVWRGVAGRTHALSAATQIGGALAFSGTAHRELSDFDALHPSLTLWADRALGEKLTLRALASYSHAWVRREPFLSAPSFQLELHRAAGERGATRWFAELVSDDYRFELDDPLLPPATRRARDRDGLGLRVGAEHRVALERFGTTLSAGAAYRRFDADGSEYSFDAAELELGFESSLPAELHLAGGVRYAYRPYRNDTTYETPPSERTEHEWRTELGVGRTLWRQLGLETRWRYQRNRSTAAVFDYRRHVVGLYASWTLNP